MAGKLWCSDIPSGKFLRANDKYIMDEWDDEGLPTHTLQILNNCRIYLKVTRLSDIVTNDGYHIQTQYINGSHINHILTHDWPRQEKPGRKAWKLWKYHLENTFYSGSRLKTPLGKWLQRSSAYELVYIPELNILQKVQNNDVFISPVVKTEEMFGNISDKLPGNIFGLKVIPFSGPLNEINEWLVQAIITRYV